MSTFATHLVTGAAFGIVGLFLLRDEDGPPAGPLFAFNVLVWSALAATAPDLDRLMGGHRSIFTNIWVGFVIPGFVVSLMATAPQSRHPFFRALLPVLPASFGSHVILDMWGWTGWLARVFWPLSDTVYVRPEVTDTHNFAGMPGVDAGLPVMAFVLYFEVYIWGHMRVSAWIRERVVAHRAWYVAGFTAAGTLLAVLPVLVYWAMGWMVAR